MKKIVSLFQRNYEGNRKVRNEVSSGAEWVVEGEGIVWHHPDGRMVKIKKADFPY